jgi:hypothetical protein
MKELAVSTEISKTRWDKVVRKKTSSKMGLNKIRTPKRVAAMMNHLLTKVVKVSNKAVQVAKKMMKTRMAYNKMMMMLRNGRTNTATQV